MCEKLTPETIFDPNTEISLQDCYLQIEWWQIFVHVWDKRYQLDSYWDDEIQAGNKQLQLVHIIENFSWEIFTHMFTIEVKVKHFLNPKVKIINFLVDETKKAIQIVWNIIARLWPINTKISKTIHLKQIDILKILEWYNWEKWENYDIIEEEWTIVITYIKKIPSKNP